MRVRSCMCCEGIHAYVCVCVCISVCVLTHIIVTAYTKDIQIKPCTAVAKTMECAMLSQVSKRFITNEHIEIKKNFFCFGV